MLTYESLSDREQAAGKLILHLEQQGSGMNHTKVEGPGCSVKFLGVMWAGKTKVMPEEFLKKYFQNNKGFSPPHICSCLLGPPGLLATFHFPLSPNP